MKLFGFVVLSVVLASISTFPLDSTETDFNEHIGDNGWMHELWEKVKAVEESALKAKEDNGIIDIWKKIKQIWAYLVAHILEWVGAIVVILKSIIDQFLPDVMDLVKEIGQMTKETLKEIDEACKRDPSGCIEEVRSKIQVYEMRIGFKLFAFGKVIYAKLQKMAVNLITHLVKIIVDIINKIIHNDDVAFIHKELKANNNVWEIIKEVLKKLGDAIVHFGDEMFKKLAVFGPKIIASLKKIVAKITAQLNEFIKKYKDLIIDALKKDAKVIFEEGKKIMVSLVDGVVKIIVDEIKHLITDEQFGIKEYLEISLEDSDQALADVHSKISDWFKKVWAKIKEFFKYIGKSMKDDLKKFNDMCFRIVQKWMKDTREMRAIISVILKEYAKQILAHLEDWVNKYKDLILNELKKDAKVFIAEYRKLATALVDEIVKIVTDAIKHLITNMPMEKLDLGVHISPNSFWKKILDTVKKIKGVIKESTLKTLEKYKPEILDAVKNLKDVIIACGKDIVIQVSHGIVKIITDGWTVMSDDSNPEEFYFKGHYDMIILPEKTA